MTGMRHKLMHDHLGVDLEIVRLTVIRDLPLLKKYLHYKPK